MKKSYDSVGLTIDSALHLTRQIREAEAEREKAKTESERHFTKFLFAKSRLNRAEASKDLLKRRRQKLVRRGLESLKVEPIDPSEFITASVPSLGLVSTQDPILDPSSQFLGGFPINPSLQADLDALFGRGAGPSTSKGS